MSALGSPPCFERLRGNRNLAATLAGIAAAVVGVIASLAVFFGYTSCSTPPDT